MSKNIIIQEGGTAKQMTVNKLKTDKVGGGSCLWVPEDEVPLGTKSITANGTYTATSDGKYGYSQVTVNVAGAAGSADSSGKPISSGGEPTIGSSVIGIDPTDGETYEYSVDSNGDVTKIPAPTVEPSGAGSSVIGIDPTDGETYEYSVDSNGDVTKTLVPTITPGGPGSGVVGTDPEDGNEYFIGINEGGNIVKTKIPSGIEIGKTPNKTNYTAGESIDYSGIIVILKGGDSAIFSNTDYPNGRVAYSELLFPVAVAPEGSGGNGSVDADGLDVGGIQSPISYAGSGTCDLESANSYRTYTWHEGSGSFTQWNITNNSHDMVWASTDPSAQWRAYNTKDEGNESHGPLNLRVVINDIPVYYYYSYGIGGTESVSNPVCNNGEAVNRLSQNQLARLAWLIATGGSGSGKTASIPVKWRSPYDGRTFEDAFEITVAGSSSSSGSTGGGGYSDDSGGSSSGGGTSF